MCLFKICARMHRTEVLTTYCCFFCFFVAELIPQNSIINLGIIVGFPAISCSQTQQRMVNTEGKPQTSHLSGMNRYLFAGCLTSRGLVPKHGWYNAQLVSQRRWNPNGLSHTFLYPHEPYISHHKPTAFVFFLLIILYLVGGLIFFNIFPCVGNNNPNWRTHIFQRGRYTTNQIIINHH